MIYFDNAATSWPKPEDVYRAMDKFLRQKSGNPGRGGHSLSLAAKQMIDETRLLIARFINAQEIECVIFTQSCTASLNLGLKGLLKPGDHVITDSIGHNSLVRPLKKLEHQGVKITRLPPSLETDVLSIGEIEKSITSKTKLLVVTHGSNVTGVVQPIAAYGALAQKNNFIFMVDAAQTAGKYPIDVVKDKIDIVAFSGHKGLFGPPGTGVFYVGEKVEIEPIFEGGTGFQSEREEQPNQLPYRYESGTPNSVGICGLGAGLKFIISESLEKIQKHDRSLRARLIEGLSSIPGLILYSSRDTAPHTAVISMNIEGYDPEDVGTILDQTFDIKVRAGLHCAPAAHRTLGTYPKGTVRISLGYFNTDEEIDRTLKALAKIAKEDYKNLL